MRKFANLLVVVLAVLALTATAQATAITWGTVQNITGVSDVLTDGTGIVAVNCGGATTVVNGVSFTGAATSSNAPASVTAATTFTSGGPYNYQDSGAYGALPTEYKNLLAGSWYRWGQANNTQASFTVSGLTPGQQYAVQYWVNDSRYTDAWMNDLATRSLALSGTGYPLATDAPVLHYKLGITAATNLGQYVIGTFIADAGGSQTVYTTAAAGAGAPSAQVNAFQVRSVPEPSTVVLLGMAVMGLLAYAWRKRK